MWEWLLAVWAILARIADAPTLTNQLRVLAAPHATSMHTHGALRLTYRPRGQNMPTNITERLELYNFDTGSYPSRYPTPLHTSPMKATCSCTS
ncbi:MAG: hypothetical protein CFK49_01380 [Armatimonadetes bacterium JP3_11]|nr:MAG: hypothetical protein CFK48_05205 [Armatimonadetes bacterium CP1_7O]OYT75810.1 MAG: hypothetical protein CFK49_01380 [Armatimonadetes bacterium JP3_11]RMH06790.1 MAG: hypothetical protein D6697_10015 [Armatimonadota bacterium]